jgi:integrase
VQVVKLVIASAVNSEGEPLQPRTWNNDFIGLPVVNKASQHRPTITSTDIERVIGSSRSKYALLFAGTGLRIGEALGLRVSDLSPDGRVLHVRQSVWRGKEQSPKGPNAFRQVDAPEALASTLRSYVREREGYLVATKEGRPLQSRSVLRMLHKHWRGGGFHAFRRFRMTWLRKNNVPKDLEHFCQ